jgi:uncharacterized protein
MPAAEIPRAASLAACACLLLAACGGPGPSGQPVEDRAGLLTPAEVSSLAEWHRALLAQYDIDYRVLTVPQADDLADLAVRSFQAEGVGGGSRTGRGLLLVIDAGGARVRLEVARELEGVFIDSFVAFIEREQMVPFFAASRVGDGIVAASELIAGHAEEALAMASLDDREMAASSAGAGAESAAKLDEGYERPVASVATDTAAAGTPADTVAAYLAAMAAHNADAALDLYTPATREMLASHVVTRAQMDNLLRTYRDCPTPEQLQQQDVAVLRYPAAAPACSPWLLERGPGDRWRLDLITMQQAFRFDTRNHWRVANPGALGRYGFAFQD